MNLDPDPRKIPDLPRENGDVVLAVVADPQDLRASRVFPIVVFAAGFLAGFAAALAVVAATVYLGGVILG